MRRSPTHLFPPTLPVVALYLLVVTPSGASYGAAPGLVQTEIFPPIQEHVHGSTIVELPNGDLLAAWFQGSGERWADDVTIMGARLKKGQDRWSEPFLMADTPGFPRHQPDPVLGLAESAVAHVVHGHRESVGDLAAQVPDQ